MANELKYIISALDQSTAAIERISARLDKLERKVDRLDGKKAEIKVDVDDRRALTGLERLADRATKASKTVRLTQRTLVSLVGAAATLTPAVAAATGAFVAFGAVAAPSIVKVAKGASDAIKNWDTLNDRQMESVRVVNGLVDQFEDLNQQFEPQALEAFNIAIGTSSTLLEKWTPLIRAGSTELVTFASRLNAELTNPEWTEFFNFLATSAASSMRSLTDALFGLLEAARDMTVALAPLSGVTLDVVGGLARLVGTISEANPMLVQMVALALLLRAPMIGMQNAVSTLAQNFLALETAGKRAAAAMKLVGKAAVLLALTAMIQLWSEASIQAERFADTIVARSPDINDQISAVSREIAKQDALIRHEYEDALPSYAEGLFLFFNKPSREAAANAEALRSKLEELKAERRAEAVAARIEGDATGFVSQALEIAADKAKTMETRLKALKAALDRIFNPSIQAFNAVTKLKKGFDDLASASRKADDNFKGKTEKSRELRDAFAQQLETTRDLGQAIFQKTRDMGKARQEVKKQLPILYAYAGNSKEARQQVDALARSMGIATGRSNISRKGFIRSARQMGINRNRAERLWREYNKIPRVKETKVRNNAGRNRKPWRDLDTYLDKLTGIPSSVSTTVRLTRVERSRTPGGHPHSTPARGGLVARYVPSVPMADGGFAGRVRGPGSGMSDTAGLFALSNGEYVINARSVKMLGVPFFDAINGMNNGGPVGGGFARGGITDIAMRYARYFGFNERTARRHGDDSFIQNFIDSFKEIGELPDKTAKVFEDGSYRLARASKEAVKETKKPFTKTSLLPQGKDLVSGLIFGITKQTPAAKRTSMKLSRTVRDVYKPAGRWLDRPGRSVVHGLTTGMRRAMPSAHRATTHGVSGVLRRWNRLRDTRRTASYVVNSVMAPLVSRFNSVARSFGARTVNVPGFSGGGFVEARRFARGGEVQGPGTSTSDSILARLSNGEFVVNAEATKANRPLLEALNKHQSAPKGDRVPQFARGGYVGDKMFFDPKGWYRDHAGPVMDRLGKLTGNAFDRALAKAPPRIYQAALARIQKLYEMFGVGNVAAGLRFAMREDGKPYVWGGVGPHGYDCSGLHSAITRVILGYRNPYQRMFTTASFGGGNGVAGFVRGRRSNYMIGVNPGSHMAGTIMMGSRRFNIESGGTSGGVGVNGRAGGAFTRNWSYRFGMSPGGSVRGDNTRGGLEGLFNAKGGWVSRNQWSIVGENGPELVKWRDPARIFSNRASERIVPRAHATAAGTTIIVNVAAGLGADGRKAGREVVEVLRDYERSTGAPLPIKVRHP